MLKFYKHFNIAFALPFPKIKFLKSHLRFIFYDVSLVTPFGLKIKAKLNSI